MPRFNGQNKKRINPRYFLEELFEAKVKAEGPAVGKIQGLLLKAFYPLIVGGEANIFDIIGSRRIDNKLGPTTIKSLKKVPIVNEWFLEWGKDPTYSAYAQQVRDADWQRDKDVVVSAILGILQKCAAGGFKDPKCTPRGVGFARRKAGVEAEGAAAEKAKKKARQAASDARHGFSGRDVFGRPQSREEAAAKEAEEYGLDAEGRPIPGWTPPAADETDEDQLLGLSRRQTAIFKKMGPVRQIVMYGGKDWCVWCQRAKEYMNKRGIKYTVKDVAQGPRPKKNHAEIYALAKKQNHPKRPGQPLLGWPTFLINGVVVDDFSKNGLAKRLVDRAAPKGSPELKWDHESSSWVPSSKK